MIVYQCIQAVDLFGLEVEGIYRLSGTASHIMKIKAMFDNGELNNPMGFNRLANDLQTHLRWTFVIQKASFMMLIVSLVF